MMNRAMNILIKTSYRILVLSILFSLPLYAQEMSEEDLENKCYQNEFITKSFISEGKNQNALKQLSKVARIPLTVTHKGKYNRLLEQYTPGKIKLEVAYDEKPLVENNRRFACNELKRRARKQKRDGKAIVRNIECDCNAPLQANVTPDDQYFRLLWGLHQLDRNGQPNVDLDATDAWNYTTGSSDTVVAVIDTGVDYNHPDLKANMWRNPNEIAGNGFDDDGNGYIDDVYGINAITGAGNPMDDHGHGTHVAGTIGAIGNNNIGVVGVNWNIKIIGAKFLSSSGRGSTYNAVRCVDYINKLKSDQGINVILTSNSWGGGGYSSSLSSAINRAQALGILFIAAAGNSARNNDHSPHYPSSYGHDNVISVAAIDSTGNLASFSNYGTRTVDIAAPGVYIASTYPGARYVSMSGTSMATPHVSGALALLYSYAPSLTWDQLKNTLYHTGVALPSLNGIIRYGKTTNAYNMLKRISDSPPPTPTPRPTPTPVFTPTPTPSPTPTPVPTAVPPGYVDITIYTKKIDGTAIEGVQIQLNHGTEKKVKFTGAGGVAVFEDIYKPVNYSVIATNPQYTFEEVSGYLAQDITHIIFGTERTYTLSGMVLDDKGEPLADVTINAGELGSVVTTSSGKFSFEDVPYGTEYELIASAEDFYFERNYLGGVLLGDTGRIFVGALN